MKLFLTASTITPNLVQPFESFIGRSSQGLIYVGSSGGSMVVSQVQDAASFFFEEPEPEALEIGGLGLVNFEIYPMHDQWWSEDLVEKIKAKRNPTFQYYLIRDGQAVGVEDDQVTTYGEVVKLGLS